MTWLVAAFGLCLASTPTFGAVNRAIVTPSAAGPTIDFTDADIVFAPGDAIPATGWTRQKLRLFWSYERDRNAAHPVHTIWARFRFDRASLGTEPLAIYTENNRQRITVIVNGLDIFRNFATSRDPILGWNHPYLIPLPKQFLRPGLNDVIIRAESESPSNLSVGGVKIGPNAALLELHRFNYFWRIAGPKAANFAMLFLTVAVLLMWTQRRRDFELPVLAMTGLFWFARNYHFFAEQIPFDPGLFIDVTTYSLYFSAASSFAFCLVFLGLWRSRAGAILLTIMGAGLTLLFLTRNPVDPTSSLPTILMISMALAVCGLVIKSWRETRSADHLQLSLVLGLGTAVSLHDYGRIYVVNWWDGLGFFIQPFLGAILFAAFFLSVGRRYLSALSVVEDMNLVLEARVSEASEKLAISEAVRRTLEVASAVEKERERIMREVHDEVGSSIVTALSISKQQQHPPKVIATLRRVLADLKIAVDSLEPIDGDIVALLANLRHRMEPDLRQAGLTCVWTVEDCPPLDWLDPVNALHIMRILQEGVSNVLTHANATKIEFKCVAEALDGRAGVHVAIIDNGDGFDPQTVNSTSRGIANMQARARSLNGQLAVASDPEHGTNLALWLPVSVNASP